MAFSTSLGLETRAHGRLCSLMLGLAPFYLILPVTSVGFSVPFRSIGIPSRKRSIFRTLPRARVA